jgi:hypothetical protein
LCSDAFNPRDWTCAQVVEWLQHEVGLPEYERHFTRNKIDGARLLRLDDDVNVLQDTVGVQHPLHCRKIQLAIQRLREREIAEFGVFYDDLDEYLAKLDNRRLTMIAHLKATFDSADEGKRGNLDADQLRSALGKLPTGTDSSFKLRADEADEWVRHVSERKETVSFPTFVERVLALCRPSAEAAEEPPTSPSPPRKGAARAHGPRIHLVDGHVQLNQTQATPSAAGETKKGGDRTLEAIAREMKDESDGGGSPTAVVHRGTGAVVTDKKDWDSVEKVKSCFRPGGHQFRCSSLTPFALISV